MSQPSESTCSMLLVEDDGPTRDLLVTMVKRRFSHCIIHTAANGIDGYRIFQEFAPDIVLVDINLPVMDGLEMAKMIRSLNSETALIALTAHTKIDGFSDLGFCSHIKKPFSVSELFTEIERCCPACLRYTPPS